MERALFLEGEPGVGKTEVAKVLSRAFETPLIRLQCYEGLDLSQAVYEWNYPRQLLEIQARGASGAEARHVTARHLRRGVPAQAAAAAGDRPEPRAGARAADR